MAKAPVLFVGRAHHGAFLSAAHRLGSRRQY